MASSIFEIIALISIISGFLVAATILFGPAIIFGFNVNNKSMGFSYLISSACLLSNIYLGVFDIGRVGMATVAQHATFAVAAFVWLLFMMISSIASEIKPAHTERLPILNNPRESPPRTPDTNVGNTASHTLTATPEASDVTILAARVKQLEAMLAAQQTTSGNGVAKVTNTLNAVLGSFPRWLIVAAGVVVVTAIAWGAWNQAIIINQERALKTLRVGDSAQ